MSLSSTASLKLNSDVDDPNHLTRPNFPLTLVLLIDYNPRSLCRTQLGQGKD